MKTYLKLAVLVSIMATSGQAMAGIENDESREEYTLRGDGDQAYRGIHEAGTLKVYKRVGKTGRKLVAHCPMSKNSLRGLVGSTRVFRCGKLASLSFE